MQPFIDAEPIEPGTCPAPDDQLVTVRPAVSDPNDAIRDRANALIASGLTYAEYRELQCAAPGIGESAEGLRAVVERLESAAFLRTVCQCGARRIA